MSVSAVMGFQRGSLAGTEETGAVGVQSAGRIRGLDSFNTDSTER